MDTININHSQQIVELVKFGDDDLVKVILELEKRCFPKEWLYDDEFEYYSKALKIEGNINLLLREDKIIVGYLLSVPLGRVFADLQKYDPILENKADFFYLDTIEIIPKSRGRGGAKQLILKMCEELNKRGVFKFSLHARTINGLNVKIKKMYPDEIISSREIKRWYFGGNEKYEYVEWGFNHR
jgi:ribosomal protein S18 acetylase RimI-like enzyme